MKWYLTDWHTSFLSHSRSFLSHSFLIAGHGCSYMPEFYLRKYILDNYPTGRMEKAKAEAVKVKKQRL